MHNLGLTNDIIFKLVFGAEKREAILRGLLNAVLDLPQAKRITEIHVLNPTLDKQRILDKNCILDIRARDAQGRRFNVEVQVSREPDYINRSLYYLAGLFSEQLDRGDGYDEVCQTVGISFLDFALFPDQIDLHSTFRFYDTVHQRTLTDVLEIHYIELSKFKQERPQQLGSRFERWLHILKFGELYQSEETPIPEVLKQDEEVAMALKAYRQVSSSEEVHQMMVDRLKAERDEATRLSRARKEGIAEGWTEAQQAFARKMLADGLDRDQVCRLLGLTPDQLP